MFLTTILLTFANFQVKYKLVNIDREKIQELISSGVSPSELYQGVEIEVPGIVGLTERIVVKTPKQKRDLLYVQARQGIQKNKDSDKPLTGRNILQKIGGGPLKKDEWLQISQLPNNAGLRVTGTRGIFEISTMSSNVVPGGQQVFYENHITHK